MTILYLAQYSKFKIKDQHFKKKSKDGDWNKDFVCRKKLNPQTLSVWTFSAENLVSE